MGALGRGTVHPLTAAPERVVLLGAHCDDIAIGAGATLLRLCRARPGLVVDALVLSGGGTPREAEERAALAAFCPGARLGVRVGDLPDGRMPGDWAAAKALVGEFRRSLGTPEPELVLAPHAADAHQDHRLLAELVWQEFRDHLVLGYEILKFEGDLPTAQSYVPADAATVADKVALLRQHYPSQHGRAWFDAEAFTGLMRIRGVQCQQAYAEGFVTPKLTLAVADRATTETTTGGSR